MLTIARFHWQKHSTVVHLPPNDKSWNQMLFEGILCHTSSKEMRHKMELENESFLDVIVKKSENTTMHVEAMP